MTKFDLGLMPYSYFTIPTKPLWPITYFCNPLLVRYLNQDTMFPSEMMLSLVAMELVKSKVKNIFIDFNPLTTSPDGDYRYDEINFFLISC